MDGYNETKTHNDKYKKRYLLATSLDAEDKLRVETMMNREGETNKSRFVRRKVGLE